MNNLFQSHQCLECGRKLAGRIDKKFCDAYCRNTYNNRHKADEEKYMQQVNSVIRKNRRILKTLCPSGKATVRKEVLDTMGFQYPFFSGIYRSPAPGRQLYYVCYDFAFSPILQKGIEKALIVQRQDYFKSYLNNPWQFLT